MKNNSLKIGIFCKNSLDIINLLKSINHIEIFFKPEEDMDIIITDQNKNFTAKEIWGVFDETLENICDFIFLPTTKKILELKIKLYRNRHQEPSYSNKVVNIIVQDLYKNFTTNNILLMEWNIHFLNLISLEKIDDENLIKRIFNIIEVIPFYSLNYKKTLIILMCLYRMNNKIEIKKDDLKKFITNYSINKQHFCYEILKELQININENFCLD